MNNRQFLMVFVVAVSVFLGGTFLVGNFSFNKIQAEEPVRGWEYCYIETWGGVTKDVTKSKTWVDINYYGADGIYIERITAETDKFEKNYDVESYNLQNTAVSKAIFKLGNERWEMVEQGKSIVADRNFIYFKRPKK